MYIQNTHNKDFWFRFLIKCHWKKPSNIVAPPCKGLRNETMNKFLTRARLCGLWCFYGDVLWIMYVACAWHSLPKECVFLFCWKLTILFFEHSILFIKKVYWPLFNVLFILIAILPPTFGSFTSEGLFAALGDFIIGCMSVSIFCFPFVLYRTDKLSGASYGIIFFSNLWFVLFCLLCVVSRSFGRQSNSHWNVLNEGFVLVYI